MSCPFLRRSLGINHFAVQAEDLADLRQEFEDKGVRLDHNTDRGMTSSIYFFDPDGNRIEYFCNNQDDAAEGLRLMGDLNRQNKEVILS